MTSVLSSEGGVAMTSTRRATSRSFAENVGGIVHLRGEADVYAGSHRHFGSYPEHVHSFLEVVLVTGGTGIHNCAFGRNELNEGDVLIVQPGLAHAYTECRDLRLVNCGMKLSLFDRELKWTLEDPRLGPLVAYDRAGGESALLRAHLTKRWYDESLEALRRVETCRLSNEPTAPSDSLAYLILFLGRLASGAAGSWNVVSSGELPPAIKEAASLLRDNLGHDWSLTELAERLHMSPGHISRQFSAAMGQPPLVYLARQRAEAAARRLIASDLPVASIGAEVGWADANYFSRRFKTHFGISPSEYRRRFSG